MRDLSAAVQKLAEARRLEAGAKELLSEIESEIEDMIDEKFGRSLKAAKLYLGDVRLQSALADTSLRNLAVAVFVGPSNQSGHPGAKVVESTVLGYAMSDAIDYCREHLPQALSLKKRDFEKAAKVLELDFVTFRKEPTVRIPRDLSRWLPGGGG